MPRGARRLPRACLEALERADHVLHGGDLVAASVLEELSAIAPVDAVAGNMDDATLQAALPARRTVEIEGVRIGMVHDGGPRLGREERLRRAFPACGAVIYGHTHVPQLERHGDVWIVNPGSPTERRGAPRHSMALLRVDDGTLEPRLVPL
jgi:putative phosphoesterase